MGNKADTLDRARPGDDLVEPAVAPAVDDRPTRPHWVDAVDPDAGIAVDVEVWSSSIDTWCGGFEAIECRVVAGGATGVTVRRKSDGWVLPRVFSGSMVRPVGSDHPLG